MYSSVKLFNVGSMFTLTDIKIVWVSVHLLQLCTDLPPMQKSPKFHWTLLVFFIFYIVPLIC